MAETHEVQSGHHRLSTSSSCHDQKSAVTAPDSTAYLSQLPTLWDAFNAASLAGPLGLSLRRIKLCNSPLHN
ncbi:hypothetical protein MES5069_270193 [Mesorhizobium escarrei]|uniref:Uncharacterized protein n=1 Tax=Mesorhizobium escarrei TaxID=666018 RepID=A0ABM9DW79_9HYPH|nr:hypothetical protein MES5069_270193 [Mesorhizobium escarrei]